MRKALRAYEVRLHSNLPGILSIQPLVIAIGKEAPVLRPITPPPSTRAQGTAEIPEDESIEVALAAAGDSRAFERLYRRHVGRVHSLLRRMVGSDEADEATQDAFVRAWRAIGSFRGDSAFGTWVHRIAVNVALASRRGKITNRQRFLDDEDFLNHHPDRPDRSSERLDFEAALSTLPHGAREVLVLHDVEGFRHEEIAELLDISSGTSKSQLHRARMAIRKVLNA